MLLELCLEIDPDFNKYLDDIIQLNPYATLFRYPDQVLEPDKPDVLIAIQIAEKFLHFVIGKLSISSVS